MILCNEDKIKSHSKYKEMNFALKYLLNFTKKLTVSKYMHIEIDESYPLKLKYTIQDEGYINGYYFDSQELKMMMTIKLSYLL